VVDSHDLRGKSSPAFAGEPILSLRGIGPWMAAEPHGLGLCAEVGSMVVFVEPLLASVGMAVPLVAMLGAMALAAPLEMLPLLP